MECELEIELFRVRRRFMVLVLGVNGCKGIEMKVLGVVIRN